MELPLFIQLEVGYIVCTVIALTALIISNKYEIKKAQNDKH